MHKCELSCTDPRIAVHYDGMMINWHETGRRKLDANEIGLYRGNFARGNFAVVLSLVFSLTVIAIISRSYVLNSPWIVGAFAAPIPIFIYFENRIIRFGVFTSVAAIILPLGAAVLFGL